MSRRRWSSSGRGRSPCPPPGPQLLLVEDLGDEAGVAQGGDHPALAGGDPGRLLAAVLQRVEAEVGQAGDVVPRCVYAEDAAFLPRPLAIEAEPLVGQSALSSSGLKTDAQAGRLPTCAE